MIALFNTKVADYQGSILTEKKVIDFGYKRLSGTELKERINNSEVFGYYPGGFTFTASIYNNGTTEGVNNVGTRDKGIWRVDYEQDTLQLEWENSWHNTTTHAFEINRSIEFFDVDNGSWRTTFKNVTIRQS